LFYLEDILIEGFRNYRRQKLQPHPRLNIIIGENGQGKTNLLESIFYLSVTRSFRTNQDRDLVHWEGNFFSLKASFFNDNVKNVVKIGYRHNEQLKIFINNNPVNRYEHMHQFPIVVFSPDDILLIREGPAVRRRFINLEASRLNPLYLHELKEYHRVLLHRNSVLKNYGNSANIGEMLAPWDQALVKLGLNLIRARVELIKTLEKEARVFFNQMTGARENLHLDYESTVDYRNDYREMENVFCEELLTKRGRELKRGYTLTGPHLDDLKIKINGFDARRYSSQGQKRTAALALKMAEVSLFKKHNEVYPIVLLDDVFSEFDYDRKRHLLDFLNNNAGQCFLTSAVSLDELIIKLNKDYKIITVSQGSVINETVRTGS